MKLETEKKEEMATTEKQENEFQNLQYCLVKIKDMNVAKQAVRVRNDDVFSIGYPKSGTTWIEGIIWLMQNNLDYAEEARREHGERVPFIDPGVITKDFLESMPSPRTFKSHLAVKSLPFDINAKKNSCKVVYIVRNPKDVCLSAYNYSKDIVEHDFEGTLNEYIDLFLEGKTSYGSWWEHVNAYTSLPNVHVVHYEDLIENPLQTCAALSKYLGKGYSPEQLEQLVTHTSFKNMKKKDQSFVKAYQEKNIFKPGMKFFRTGKIGNWAKSFDESSSKNFDKIIKENLKYQGKFNYGVEETEA